MTLFTLIVILATIVFLIALPGALRAKEASRILGDVVQVPDPNTGKLFWVVDSPTKVKAAARLAEVLADTTDILLALSESSHAHTEEVTTLLSRLSNQRITLVEIKPKPGTPVAINTNKGQFIQLCLFDPVSQDPVGHDALYSVVVHELAHMMETAVSRMVNGHSVHSDQFKRNEALLMTVAKGLGLISEDGAVGARYCGITIPDPAFAG